MATIQEVYIALFGRPADPIGLRFYNEATDNGNNLDAVGELSGSEEYLSRFEGQNDVQAINQIFQDLFGRDADAQGLLFYTQLLQSGQASIQDIAIRIIDGATGSDQAIVDAKVAAANLFTASLDQGSEIVAYSGEAGITFGQAYLDQVTSAATVPTQAQVDAQIAAFVADPGVVGNLYTLTNANNLQTGGVDEIEGSSNNDTIRAVLEDSLDSSDIINGGEGNDVLNISAGAIDNTGATVAAPVISNVETINNAGGDLNLTDVTGANRINSSASAAYTGAALATVFAITGDAGATVEIDYAGSLAGDTTVNLATALTASGTADFDLTADGADIENVALDVAAAAGVTTTANLDGLTAVETITLTGAGNTVVTSDATTLESFDASAATGTVSFTSDVIANDVTATGGSANDTLDFTLATGEVTLNGGAGNDTLRGGTADDVIAGGEGADTMTGNGGEDTFVIEGGITVGSFDTVTDFATGVDNLDFGGPAGSATNYTQLAASLSFNDAREAANSALNGTVVYAETAIGNTTYVFADTNGDGTADQVVALTGNAPVAVDFGDII